MPELATAWITLAVSADNMRRDIKRELNGLDGRQAFGKFSGQLETAVSKSAKASATQVEGTLSQRPGTKVGTVVGQAIGRAIPESAKSGLRSLATLAGRSGDEAGRDYARRFSAAAGRARVSSASMHLPATSRGGGGGAASALGGAAAGGVGALARVAAPAAAAVLGVGSAVGVLSAGFDRLKAIDDARFKLQALGNDSKTTAKIMDSALASVKGTSYGLGDAAAIAASAVAAGVKPGEDLTKYLKMTADAAAVAGTDLGDMGHIINQVRTGQKAYTEDLNQLSDRGIPIYQWIGEAAGVAAGDVKKLASDGKISSQMFEDAIQKHIGGAAQKMGKSFEGSMQNVKASIGRLGAAVLEPFFGLGGDALGKLTGAIDKAGEFIKAHQPEIVTGVSKIAAIFAEMTGKATTAFATLIRGFASTAESVGPFITKLGGILENVGSISVFGNKLLPEAEDAGKALKVIGDGMATGAPKLREFANGVEHFGDNITSSADKIKAWGDRTADAQRFTRDLGAAMTLLPDKKTIKLDDNTPEVLAKIDQTQYRIEHMPDGTVTITALTEEASRKANAWRQQQGGEPADIPLDVKTAAAEAKLRAFRESWKNIEITATVTADKPVPKPGADPTVQHGGTTGFRAFGAIVPMADGGLQWMRKPQSAGLYAGRGAGTIFAEEETGGEAYIPLSPSKRPRSLAILMEVARLFGLGRMADDGITIDSLKQFASGVAGIPYNWGAGDGDTFNTDCSGAQSTIANYLTGASGRFSTGNEAQALLARGFRQGDPPAGISAYWIGWKNGGPGGGHTAGTIVDPDGGNVNVEMGDKGGQYGSGAAGASSFPNRAWIAIAGGDDPNNKTGGGASARLMSAQASVRSSKAASAAAQKDLDDANAELAAAPEGKKRAVAEKKRDAAQRRLDAATDRQATAEQRLSEVRDKEAAGAEKDGKSGDNGGQNFGQSLASGLFGGLMESIGLHGFSNILEWPNVKSAQGVA